ncbi:cytochrome c oxidase assembly protein [Streptomyces platensis]|uniref:cytochrome c oxidase assembly protein n=1 Tax=Streptomyces platensis TaxID=58346 RepID=UPI00379A3085
MSRASWTTRFWASTTPTQETTLSTGSLAVLYFAPVYNTTLDNPAGHWPLHAHFLLSGSLFAYVKAGLDPAPTRPGVRARLIFSASRSRRTR